MFGTAPIRLVVLDHSEGAEEDEPFDKPPSEHPGAIHQGDALLT